MKQRHRLRAGERSAHYKPGQFVARDYAARYPDKVKRARAHPKPPAVAPVVQVSEAPPIEEPEYGELWEITVEYDG